MLLVVCLVAFVGSTLTLFSGFGLGTALLPAMALLFPPAEAVAATGAVHLLNNLFKGGLVGRNADWCAVAKFGLPAIVGSIAGALTLAILGSGVPVFHAEVFGQSVAPNAAAMVIGALLIVFAILEVNPWFQTLTFTVRWLPLGGLVTGFLGGLSGQQGALRSAFLLKSLHDPQRFIATGIVIAILIDFARLPTYALHLAHASDLVESESLSMLGAATLSAFAGAWLGARYMQKVTIVLVRVVVAAMMIVIGVALASGLLAT